MKDPKPGDRVRITIQAGLVPLDGGSGHRFVAACPVGTEGEVVGEGDSFGWWNVKVALALEELIGGTASSTAVAESGYIELLAPLHWSMFEELGVEPAP